MIFTHDFHSNFTSKIIFINPTEILQSVQYCSKNNFTEMSVISTEINSFDHLYNQGETDTETFSIFYWIYHIWNS